MLLPPCLPQQCGKDFRNSLKQPSPNYPYGYKTKKPRIVPAFTIQSMQKNTIVQPPPKCNIYEPQPARPTMFRKSYRRGEFPVTIEFTLSGKRLSWKVIWDLLLGTLRSAFSSDTMNSISRAYMCVYFCPKYHTYDQGDSLSLPGKIFHEATIVGYLLRFLHHISLFRYTCISFIQSIAHQALHFCLIRFFFLQY